VQRIDVTNDRMGDSIIFEKRVLSDIEKLRTSLEDMDMNEFDAVVDAILAAKRIYITGRSEFRPYASFSGFSLTDLRKCTACTTLRSAKCSNRFCVSPKVTW
jgi:DNA-binding MurR/RpiR family transcriptional regulator